MGIVAAPSPPVPGTALGVHRPWIGTSIGRSLPLRLSRRLCHGLLGRRFVFGRARRLAGDRVFRWSADGCRDFGWLGGAKPSGAFLGLGFPVGATESFRSGEIPPAGIGGIADGFEIAGEFERDHGVARFGEKIG